MMTLERRAISDTLGDAMVLNVSAPLRLAGIAAVALAASCVGHRSETDDTCEFADDADSCWRTLVRDVQTCMGSALGKQGDLSDDGMRCSNTSGLRVTFTEAVNVSVLPTRLDATILTNTLVECAHVVADRTTGDLSVSGSDGKVLKLTMDGDGRDATVTCPSGARHHITGQSVMDVCFAQVMGGGLPAVKMQNDGTSASLAFSGSAWKLYDCR
jgi:hypothetical protein